MWKFYFPKFDLNFGFEKSASKIRFQKFSITTLFAGFRKPFSTSIPSRLALVQCVRDHQP